MISALIALIAYGLVWFAHGYQLSPDGSYYLASGRGHQVPSPYAYRLLPKLLRGNRPLWTLVSGASLVGSAVLIGRMTAHPILAALLFIGLPGLFRLNVIFPVLVDAPAFFLALLSVDVLAHGHPAWALVIIALAGLIKETAPIFVAAWTFWWPAALTGLLIHGLIRLSVTAAKADQPWLKHPFQEARKVQNFFDWKLMLLPWGALPLLVAFSNLWAWNVVATVALAYSQLLVAQDHARLYQWAFPPLVVVALANPPAWIPLAVFVHLFNPYRGT